MEQMSYDYDDTPVLMPILKGIAVLVFVALAIAYIFIPPVWIAGLIGMNYWIGALIWLVAMGPVTAVLGFILLIPFTLVVGWLID
jgi:hypothetical protein